MPANHFCREDSYTYTLFPTSRPIVTGSVASSQQALVGLMIPRMCAILFDEHGRMVGVKDELISEEALRCMKKGYFTDESQGKLRAELEMFKESMGFVSAPIRIRRFNLPNCRARIQDFPDFIEDVLTNPAGHSQQDVDEVEQSFIRWRAEGQYILFCFGQEYWVNGAGEIVAT